jgi:hypothetical protein
VGVPPVAAPGPRRAKAAAAAAQPYVARTSWGAFLAMVLSLVAALLGAMLGARQADVRFREG